MKTRREFLGTSSAAVAAVPLQAGRAASSQSPSSSGKRIRLAVVGGGFGATFLWHEHPHCEVVAVTDLHEARRDRLRRQYRCDNAYNSFEELLSRRHDLDAVAIFSDAPSHVKHVEMSFERGLHVCCAVPACHTLEDAEKLKDMKQKTGLRYMMAESSYYRGGCIYSRERFRNGDFGELFYSEIEYYHDLNIEKYLSNKKSLYWNPDGSASWRQGWQPMHYPTHSLAYLVGVSGERISRVACLGWADQHLLAKLESRSSGKTFFNQVALMVTDQDHMVRCNEFRVAATDGIWVRAQWFGDRASFYMAKRGYHGDVWHPRFGKPETIQLPEYWKSDQLTVQSGGHGGSAGFICSEFINALVKDREPEIDLYESLAMTVPGIVAHLSALKGGEQLKVPAFERPA